MHPCPRQFRGLLAALLAGSAAFLPSAFAQGDLATVTGRISADEQAAALSSPTVQGYRDSLSATGTWDDVDYPDKSVTGWSPSTHTARLLEMTRAYRKPGHTLFGNAALSNAIHVALRWWTTNDFTSSNWWYNEIDTPRKLGRTLLLLGGEASSNELAASLTMLNRSQNYMSWTGQNRLWEAGNTLIKGLILSNAGICATSSAAINGLFITQTSEGVMPDYSFQQHGPQLYTGGYGASFAADAPFWLDMLRGTAWAATTAQTAVITRYLLDGVRWEIWEKQWAFDVTGRGISRGVPGATSLVTPFLRMTNAAPAYAAQFAAFAGALGGAGVFGNTMRGHVHYWWCDQSVHRASNWSVTVRMCSTRVQGTETGNNEGLKDYYLGDGTTYFLADGNEYRSIQPMWNWRKLPGVTCPQRTGALPVLGWSGYMGGSSFVGGFSDGTNGAAIMNLVRDGLSLSKASFLFDDAAVFLGAGVRFTNDTTAIATTINQSLLNTAAAYARIGATQTVSSGQFVLTNALWVQQDGFGYLRLGTNDEWNLTLQTQTGRWYDINNAASTQWLGTNVFTLFINHGSKPAGGSYAYAVVPAATSSVMPALAASPPVAVLTNATTLQAAYHFASHQLQAVFQAAGGVTTPDGTRLEADAPCILGARMATGGVTLCAARPDHSTATLTVRVSRALSGPGATWLPAQWETQIVIPMPSGNRAGSSTSVVLTGIALSAPGISSAYGADAWMTTATLRGALTNGGAADVTVVWDASNRGTNPASWASSAFLPGLTEGDFSVPAGGLSPGSSYVYRCYASNAYGRAWSDPRTFVTAPGAAPTNLAGLSLWLEAGDARGNGTILADGTAVTNWADKSGHGRHATGAASSNSWPRYRATNFNGRAALNFNGTHYLDCGNVPLHDNATGMTLIVVCRMSGAADRAVLSKNHWSANQREWVLHSSDFQVQELTNVMNTANRITNAVNTNAVCVAGLWQPKVRMELFHNGLSLGTAASPATNMEAGSARVLVAQANNVDAARYLTGDLAEIAVYARALDPNDLNRVCASLAAKYGLAYAAEPRNPDADGDGLPDDYERAQTGGVLALAAAGDSDGDRMTDFQEYIAGTNPLDAASVFALQAWLATNGASLVLRWPAATNRVYLLQAASGAGTGYQTVESNLPPALPSNSYTTQPGAASAVFRVIVSP